MFQKITQTHVQTSEIVFFLFLIAGFLLSYAIAPYTVYAAWVGFIFASYAAVANDSIQTIGTFIASNKKRPWWLLWIFIAGVFVCTTTYSWIVYSGDVTYARLASKGFDTAPSSFSPLQIALPLILILLTRLKMPVSTTFLLLTSFSTKATAIGKVLSKSMMGYLLAFVIAMLVWSVASKWMKKIFVGTPSAIWTPLQWITTGTLWSVWLMQDAANIAVYLPRQLNIIEFLLFLFPVVAGLGWMFYQGGEKIQEIVDEKTEVVDIRSATVIDFVYAVILFYFKMHSQIPMSTTWVFLGLLGGREIAMSLQKTSDLTPKRALYMMGRDGGLALLGLIISFICALLVNDVMFEQFFG